MKDRIERGDIVNVYFDDGDHIFGAVVASRADNGEWTVQLQDGRFVAFMKYERMIEATR